MSSQNTPRPISEGLYLRINGAEQWVSLRGADRANPALMILGGPGAAFSVMAPFFAPWEQAFTLVQWDQPGAGDDRPLTLGRLADDGLDVADQVARRLGKRTVALLGVSGGSIVGLHMIRRRPALFSAYVGTGQIVDWAAQDGESYAMLLGQARAAGDREALADLERIGPPPYRDTATDAVKSKYAGALTAAERQVFAGLDPAVTAAINAPPAEATYVPQGLPRTDPRARSMAAYDELRGEIVAFDARRLGLRYEVPMIFLQGERDTFTVSSQVQAFADEIEAPSKRFVLIPGGGHSAYLLRDAFLALLVAHVRPLAASG